MNYKQIAARLTGLNCPVFGVSWNPPEAERTIARRVITALEDRRVLYVDSELEVPMRCVESVQRIRELLTQEIAPLADDAHIAPALRAIRTACRDFLNKVDGDDERRIIIFGATPGHHASWTFNAALGVLRGVVGIHVAKLAASYGLSVEDDLASILPAEEQGGE